MDGFRDRYDAGARLGARLADDGWGGAVVLGLPRGGVPVAAEVARALDSPLDVVVVRKVGHPLHREVAMGALAVVAGTVRCVENPVVLEEIPADERQRVFDAAAASEERELLRREREYRGGRAPLALEGRRVVLVDDGVATGSTMRAAVAAVRSLDPGRLGVAVPVALGPTARDLAEVADDVVCLWAPQDLRAVGQAYEWFDQTDDGEVRRLLSGGD